VVAVRFIGGHLVGYVVDDQQLTRLGLGDDGTVHPAVGAGDYHDVRLLPLPHQGSIEIGLFLVISFLEGLKARYESVDRRGGANPTFPR